MQSYGLPLHQQAGPLGNRDWTSTVQSAFSRLCLESNLPRMQSEEIGLNGESGQHTSRKIPVANSAAAYAVISSIETCVGLFAVGPKVTFMHPMSAFLSYIPSPLTLIGAPGSVLQLLMNNSPPTNSFSSCSANCSMTLSDALGPWYQPSDIECMRPHTRAAPGPREHLPLSNFLSTTGQSRRDQGTSPSNRPSRSKGPRTCRCFDRRPE